MKYERGDILTLSNNVNYVVVTTVKFEEKDYVYLINQNNYDDVMFCEYYQTSFERVNDKELVDKLLEEILPDMKDIIEEYGKEINNN